MSIPKEPRQLMINLMYLVLTALLALNVSAEVMNAFFTLEKSMKVSNEIVTESNTKVLAAIKAEADAYKTDTTKQEVLAKAQQAVAISDEFDTYMEGVYQKIFDEAGGEDPKKPGSGIPKDKKNKDLTTRLLVEGTKTVPAIGPEIYNRIIETRDQLIALVGEDKKAELMASMPLGKGIENWKDNLDPKKAKKALTWEAYNFRQLPVAAVIPMFRSWQADCKTSASAVMNAMFAESKGNVIKFDAFFPVAAAKSSYVLQGETYEADIFLSAFSTAASESTKIYVNGKELEMEEGEGKAVFSSSGSRLGTNSYNVKIDVTNPLTKETDSYEKEFAYEVGQPSIAVAADKMNVFYIGVENPVTVSAAGVSSNDIRVSMTGDGGGNISKTGKSKYNVKVTKPTPLNKYAYVTVSGGPKPIKIPFRVKRIPDPVPALAPGLSEGRIGNGNFKAYQGVIAELKNFDFEAICRVQTYDLVHIASRQDAVTSQNKGAKYNDKSRRMVNKARPGDTYYFRNIKAKCPGDNAGRKLPSMVFTIK